MNMQDILTDRQLALMQTRSRLAPTSDNNVTENKTKTRDSAFKTTRQAPPPPFAMPSQHDMIKNAMAGPVDPSTPKPLIDGNGQEVGHQYPKHPYPRPPVDTSNPSTNHPQDNAAIGVPGAHTRMVPKAALTAGARQSVMPQPGSKEDLKRRRALKEEHERLEAMKRSQTDPSPNSWYTTCSNSGGHLQVHQMPLPTSCSSSGSGSSHGQRSAHSSAPRQVYTSLSSSSARRHASQSNLSVHLERCNGLDVEESRQANVKTPTPPELKLRTDLGSAAKLASSHTRMSDSTGRTASGHKTDDDDSGEMTVMERQADTHSNPTESTRSGEDCATMEVFYRQTETETDTKARNSTDTTASHGYLTMTGTDTDGSLKTPTTAEFRDRNGDIVTMALDKADGTKTTIPTIISSSPDNAVIQVESPDSQGFIARLPSHFGQRARIVSDLGRRLSTMSLSNFMGKSDASIPSSTSGSRRPSNSSSSIATGEMDVGSMLRRSMGRAVHQELWKPDHLSTHCDKETCKTEFSFRVRKHHCRSCGGIFCDVHSAYSLPLYYPPIEDEVDDGVSHSSRTSLSLTGSASRSRGYIAASRVCGTCFEKLAHPERLLARRAAAKGIKQRPLVLHNQSDLPSTDEEDSDEEDDEKETFEEYKARKQLQRQGKLSGRNARRLFSAPVTPSSGSPPKCATDQTYFINHASISPKPASSQSSARLRRVTSSRNQPSRNLARSGTPLSRQASLTSAARNAFSPSVEALKSSSASPMDGPGTNSYFPTMPPANLPHLPGEEPNPTVTGLLATYPLAHKNVASPNSPYNTNHFNSPSQLSLGSLVGPGRPITPSLTQKARAGNSHLVISDMPPMTMGPADHLRHSAYAQVPTSTNTSSSAGLLTPDREWVPSAWGYDRETFDPDVDVDSDDELEIRQRNSPRLVVDGAFRFKANAHVTGTQDPPEQGHSHSGSEGRVSSSLAWATF